MDMVLNRHTGAVKEAGGGARGRVGILPIMHGIPPMAGPRADPCGPVPAGFRHGCRCAAGALRTLHTWREST